MNSTVTFLVFAQGAEQVPLSFVPHHPTLEQLTTISEDELSQLHGMGPKAVETLRAGLLADGLDFRYPLEGN